MSPAPFMAAFSLPAAAWSFCPGMGLPLNGELGGVACTIGYLTAQAGGACVIVLASVKDIEGNLRWTCPWCLYPHAWPAGNPLVQKPLCAPPLGPRALPALYLAEMPLHLAHLAGSVARPGSGVLPDSQSGTAAGLLGDLRRVAVDLQQLLPLSKGGGQA